MPAVVLGLIFSDKIDALLENPVTVAISLLIGGIIILWLEKKFNQNTASEATFTYKKAAMIGLIQSISIFPGVSRSAATIYGGMFQGFNRKQAAEFSFFLAVPTMFAASAYKLLKGFKEGSLTFSSNELQILAIGNIVAFVVALIAVKTFINLLTKYGFKIWGWYRIIIGIALLIYFYTK